MPKPRIIIADLDFSYIIPLQQKLVEEFFEKIDLEIISEKDYYSTFFSTPQSADILIISEELYSPDIRRHNISAICLLTEQISDQQSGNLNVKPLYKYSSTKEIVSAIIGSSSMLLRSSSEAEKTTKILLVYSACGGTGKTSVSIGISAALSKNYKRVLYINAARLQTFHPMITNKGPIVEAEVYARLASENEDAYSAIRHVIRNEGFCYIPPFRAALMSFGLSYSVFEKITLSAKDSGDYDYIIIDADTVFDEEKTRLIDIADRIIIVTKQDAASVHATNILMANISGASTEKYIFICNDFNQEEPNRIITVDRLSSFAVATNEYIPHLPQYDKLKANDLAVESSIQKVALLVM